MTRPQQARLAVSILSVLVALPGVAQEASTMNAPPLTQVDTGLHGSSGTQSSGGAITVSSLADEMLGGIDWQSNVVYGVGDGVPPTDAVSSAQARVRAKRAAIDEAMARLLEAIQAVRVDAQSTTRDFINESRVVNTAVSGLVRNAEVVELRQAEDGSFQVKMRMPIHDQKGLSGTLLPMALQRVERVGIVTRSVNPPTQSAAAPTVAPPSASVEQAAQSPKPPHYTSLILDARGAGIEPAMFPRILSSDGNVLYDLSSVDPNIAVTSGICAYRGALEQARSDPRAGDHPLMLEVTSAGGAGRTDLVVDEAAAEKIAALSADHLRNARVIVVTD